MTDADYLFNDDAPAEADRLRWLGNLHDRFSLAAVTQATYPECTFLEIGPGNGSMIRALAQAVPCVEFTLLDPTFAGLDNRCPGNRIFGRVEQLPFADSAFSRIHARLVLSHVANRSAALMEICRVLAPGGIFHLEELDFRPSMQSFAPAFDAYRDAMRFLQGASTYDREWGPILADGADLPGFDTIERIVWPIVSSSPADEVRGLHSATIVSLRHRLISEGGLSEHQLISALEELDSVQVPLVSSSLVSLALQRVAELPEASNEGKDE